LARSVSSYLLRAAVFASKAYLAQGKPYPEGADWIVLDDSLPDHPSQAWRRRRFPKLPARHRVNSVLSVAGAVMAGMGVGVVPLFMFEGEPQVHPGLLEVPNVVLTPHIASATVATRLAMANLAADNLIAFFDGRGPLTPVNSPVLGKQA